MLLYDLCCLYSDLLSCVIFGDDQAAHLQALWSMCVSVCVRVFACIHRNALPCFVYHCLMIECTQVTNKTLNCQFNVHFSLLTAVSLQFFSSKLYFHFGEGQEMNH